MRTADAADAVASDGVEVMVIGESIVDIVVDEATGSEEEHVGGSPANPARMTFWQPWNRVRVIG